MTTETGELDFSLLQETVIDKGLCTACGTCVGICPDRLLAFRWIDENPEPYLAIPPCPGCGLCLKTCPGKDIPLLELENMVFGKQRDPNKDPVGIYKRAFAAHAVDERIREAGASGGTVTALLSFALDKGIVDAAIVAGYNDDIPYRPEGKLVTQSRELPQYARSKYGGTPPVNALLNIAVTERGFSKVGVVGCPCHVHGLRKIQHLQKPKQIADSIKIVLGLICGTQFYFEGTRHLLKEWCGVESLDEVAMIDYRWGPTPGRFYVKTKTGREVLVDRYSYMFHHLFFWQRDRCTMCIDHCCELADVAFGDLWRPDSKAGGPGWNIVIARSDIGLRLLEEAEKEGYIAMREAGTDEQSRIGIELKRHRAPFMLKQRRRYGIPVPNYGFDLPHEPDSPAQFNIMPRYDKPVVELSKGERQRPSPSS